MERNYAQSLAFKTSNGALYPFLNTLGFLPNPFNRDWRSSYKRAVEVSTISTKIRHKKKNLQQCTADALALYIAILSRPYYLGYDKIKMISLFPKLSHMCRRHVWNSAEMIKGHRRRSLGLRWTPKTTYQTLLSPSRRSNRCSIDTAQKLPFTPALLSVCSQWQSECPHRTHSDKLCASESDPASRRRLTPCFPLSSCFFSLILLLYNPFSFLGISQLPGDTTLISQPTSAKNVLDTDIHCSAIRRSFEKFERRIPKSSKLAVGEQLQTTGPAQTDRLRRFHQIGYIVAKKSEEKQAKRCRSGGLQIYKAF